MKNRHYEQDAKGVVERRVPGSAVSETKPMVAPTLYPTPELSSNPLEQAGYIESSGAHLYAVLHEVPNPIARVLLVGPFAWERHSSYIPWVRWARFLAARRIETLRFDYRGTGESTGDFEGLSFDDWTDDVRCLTQWLQSRSPALPLILHGLELGALLASKIFAEGIGHAALLWAAPNNANEVLRAALLRQLAVDHAFSDANARKHSPITLMSWNSDALFR